MNESEIRLRLIEAASKTPNTHSDGFTEGVLAQARAWYAWVTGGPGGQPSQAKPHTLTLRK